MKEASFLTAILQDGIESPNFFNGKILTATDLRDEQKAQRLRARRLGQAIGDGVAYGLAVGSEGGSLTITSGLALNRAGDPLLLNFGVSLPMVPVSRAATVVGSPFVPCSPVAGTSPINAGLYLLAISSASQPSQAAAPHSGINSVNSQCISRYDVEGVQFKLIAIEANEFALAGDELLYQSKLAHACFGTAIMLAAAATNPLAAPIEYGLIDDLRTLGKLDICDVPLAVLHWQNQTFRFIDMWAVRRPCAGAPPPAQWPATVRTLPQHAMERRYLEAQAALLHFQTQLEQLRLRLGGAVADARAREHFAYLPAAGYLPTIELATAPGKEQAAGAGVFWWPQFFNRTDPTIRVIDPAYLRTVIHNSFFVDPILVGTDAINVDLFRVSPLPAGAQPDLPYLVFVRREPQVPVTPTAAPPPTETKAKGQGTLIVKVVDTAGKTLLASDADKVDAIALDTLQRTATSAAIYSDLVLAVSPSASQTKRFVQEAITVAYDTPYVKTGTSQLFKVVKQPSSLNLHRQAIYTLHLDEGAYTIVAHSASVSLISNSVKTSVQADTTSNITITLHERVRDTPGKAFGWDDILTAHGYNFDQLYMDKSWLDWMEIHTPGYGVVDPPPDDWRVTLPVDIQQGVQEQLGGWLVDRPDLAINDVSFFLQPNYRPDQLSAEPYAFVRTQDGTNIPVVLVAGDHTLNGDVPAARGGLPDIDAAVANDLKAIGLNDLQALTGAWSGLVGSALKMDASAAGTLVGAAKLQAVKLHSSFERFPGVDAAANSALQSANIKDDVGLANARAADVLQALNAGGAAYDIGFATRLISRAQGALPSSTWSLNNLGLGATARDQLGELGISTLGQLNASASGAARDMIKDRLNLSDSALDQVRSDTQAALVAGKYRLQADPGVAGIEGVTGDRSAKLVEAGISSAKELANADAARVAETLSVSEQDASVLIRQASKQYGGLDVLADTVGIEANTLTQLRDQGISSISQLHTADTQLLSGIVGAPTGAALQNTSGIVGGMIGRFRTGLLRR